MSESSFQKSVLEYLEARGGHWIKIHASSFQSSGEPDIIGCYKGLFVAFELKNPNGKGIVSKLQVHRINDIINSNGIAMATDMFNDIIGALDYIDEHYSSIIIEIQRLQFVSKL